MQCKNVKNAHVFSSFLNGTNGAILCKASQIRLLKCDSALDLWQQSVRLVSELEFELGRTADWGSEWLHLTLLHVLDGKNIAIWICCLTYRNRHEGFLVLHLLLLLKSLLTVKYGYYEYIF